MTHTRRWNRHYLLLATLITLLLLTACGGMATSQSGPAESLYGHWRLVEVNTDNERFTLNEAQPDFSLTLNKDGSAQGQAACNRWTADARVSAEVLSLERVGSTRARCRFDNDKIASLEDQYLSVLQEEVTFTLHQDRLELLLDTDERWVFARP